MIGAIIRHRGQKKFKPKEQTDLIMTPVSKYITQNKAEANKYLNKMAFGSTYERFHGSARKEAKHPCEADILQYKKFSELETVAYLQPLAI